MTDDTGERWDEDPGWPLGWRVLILMVPGMLQREAKRGGVDGLRMLRDVFSSFVLSILLFGAVLIFIPVPVHVSPWSWLVALLVIAATCIGASNAFERPLDCGSDASLAGSYRTRFFLRSALAEAVALVRLFTQAPTPAALARDQDELSAHGCDRSLVAALRHPRPA